MRSRTASGAGRADGDRAANSACSKCVGEASTWLSYPLKAVDERWVTSAHSTNLTASVGRHVVGSIEGTPVPRLLASHQARCDVDLASNTDVGVCEPAATPEQEQDVFGRPADLCQAPVSATGGDVKAAGPICWGQCPRVGGLRRRKDEWCAKLLFAPSSDEHVSMPSMPSTASAGGIGVVRSNARSMSHRWTVVSCAWRLAHQRTVFCDPGLKFGQRSSGGFASNAARRRSAPSSNQSHNSSPSSFDFVKLGPSIDRLVMIRVAQR